MRLTTAALTALFLLGILAFQSEPNAKPAPQENVHWVKLTFGLDDKSVAWDGSAAVQQGKILESAPWSFELRDRFDPASHKWFCTTVVLQGRSASSFSEPQRGVLLKVQRTDNTELKIETRQGEFDVKLADLSVGKPALFLDGFGQSAQALHS